MQSVQQIGALGKSGELVWVSVEWCTGASGRLAIKGGFEVLKMKDKRRRPDKPGGERECHSELQLRSCFLVGGLSLSWDTKMLLFIARLFLLSPGGL